mmetsp:Transcript_87163/g.241688  ORF Transcript_87163/g.241688 Transcript_87163/m.241688 type:complete len:219 (-) Transcript_87163:453-1109(-)
MRWPVGRRSPSARARAAAGASGKAALKTCLGCYHGVTPAAAGAPGTRRRTPTQTVRPWSGSRRRTWRPGPGTPASGAGACATARVCWNEQTVGATRAGSRRARPTVTASSRRRMAMSTKASGWLTVHKEKAHTRRLAAGSTGASGTKTGSRALAKSNGRTARATAASTCTARSTVPVSIGRRTASPMRANSAATRCTARAPTTSRTGECMLASGRTAR